MTSAVRHACISKSTGAGPGQTDQWGPLVSDTMLTSVVDRWGQVNGHVSRVNADGWGHWIS